MFETRDGSRVAPRRARACLRAVPLARQATSIGIHVAFEPPESSTHLALLRAIDTRLFQHILIATSIHWRFPTSPSNPGKARLARVVSRDAAPQAHPRRGRPRR